MKRTRITLFIVVALVLTICSLGFTSGQATGLSSSVPEPQNIYFSDDLWWDLEFYEKVVVSCPITAFVADDYLITVEIVDHFTQGEVYYDYFEQPEYFCGTRVLEVLAMEVYGMTEYEVTVRIYNSTKTIFYDEAFCYIDGIIPTF